jgi:hypothetical protein
MVLRFDRQHLPDKFVGLLRMGSHNAGDETHIDGGSLGIAQRAELTEGAHRGGNLGKIRFCPISMQDAVIAARIEVAAHTVADLDRRLNQVDVARYLNRTVETAPT